MTQEEFAQLIEDQEEIRKNTTLGAFLCLTYLQELGQLIHQLNQKWWDKDENGNYTRNKGEAIALMHSELSEMLEGIRKNKNDEHIPEFSSEVVEAADLFIRLLDYCAGFNLELKNAIFAKLLYNKTRKDHTKEHRETVHGKKF